MWKSKTVGNSSPRSSRTLPINLWKTILELIIAFTLVFVSSPPPFSSTFPLLFFPSFFPLPTTFPPPPLFLPFSPFSLFLLFLIFYSTLFLSFSLLFFHSCDFLLSRVFTYYSSSNYSLSLLLSLSTN